VYSGDFIRVFVLGGIQERLVLKFDPFVHNPHYHLAPDGKNIV
jgi:hypothetical protein